MNDQSLYTDLSQRFTAEYLRECLDRLDAKDGGGRRTERREGDRYPYRVRELWVDLMQPSSEWKRYVCPSRNISAKGINFLIGHFVYPDTVCQVHVRSIYNHRVVQSGKVTRCTFLEGTRGLHEVGVSFESPIDVAMFHRGAASTRILLVDDDDQIHKLTEAMLRDHNATVVATTKGEQAIDLGVQQDFDIGLLDVMMPGMDGPDVARELRSRGCMLPLIAITATTDTRQRCMDAGFDLWINKPLTRQNLSTAISSMKSDPIISSLVHEPHMSDVIDQYVHDLKLQMRDMMALLGGNDHNGLAAFLRSLEVGSASHGFEQVSRSASELLKLIDQGGDVAAVRLKARQLSRYCQAVRGASIKIALSDNQIGPN